ncbi:MAG: hypothetical protein JWO86_1257 [Myxococcaceae bacterium]|jgi:hypothetical protein|nr:hypothetical protein [Myxococcaceae bacterium]
MGTTTKSTTGTRRRLKDDGPPYARYAFWNPYNISLFLGGVVLGAATDQGWISVLTCAAEVLWMILAPDSKVLRALWFDRAFAAEKRADDEVRRKERIGLLAPNDSMRFAYLCGQKQVIERLAKDNPSLTVELLHDELAKLDVLLDDFIELGVTAVRAEHHTSTFDFPAMRRSWQSYQELLGKHGAGDPRREVAGKNIEVLRQRRARYEDLCRTIQVARGQMELIEQTFRLLGDEIMTMASPCELGGRIDELRLAVDAVRATADESFGALTDVPPSDEVVELESFDNVEGNRRQVS